MFFLYSFLLTVAFFLLSPLLLIRREKYAAGFWQRLGSLPDFDSEGKPVVWLHCVSVGETQAARPLVKALSEEYPEYKLVVSTTTRTGQELAKEIFKNEAALIFYFPFDWKFSVRRALRKIKPDVVLLTETEIWFNFIREAKSFGAKIAIINGRLSEKSAKNYTLIRRTFRRVMQRVDLALMQSNEDAQRLLSVGGRIPHIKITGNLKFDQTADDSEIDLTEYFRERFDFTNKNPPIVAASTHAPEEKLILEAYSLARQNLRDISPRLIIVPRHPERFSDVAESVKNSGFAWTRRSEAPSLRDKQAEIILLDSIGELRAAYPLAEIVFVGGSLVPHGGQSILEPAAAGKAIATGFYTMNFQSAVKEFLQKDALIQLPETDDKTAVKLLAEVFAELLRNEEKRSELGENAANVMAENRGAVAKTLENLKPLLTVS